MSDNYSILLRSIDLAIAEFGDHVPFPPTDEEKSELLGLISQVQLLVVDLSRTMSLGTQWIRYFADLTETAEAATRGFRLAAASRGILETTDSIALRGHIRFFDTVNEAEQP